MCICLCVHKCVYVIVFVSMYLGKGGDKKITSNHMYM